MGNAVASATLPIEVALPPPRPDLSVSFQGTPFMPESVLPGAAGRGRITVRNVGEAPIDAPVGVRLVAKRHPSLGDDVVLAALPPRRMRLAPDDSVVVPIRFRHLAEAQTEYYVVAAVEPPPGLREEEDMNNVSEPRSVRVRPPFTAVRAAGALPVSDGRRVIPIGRRMVLDVLVVNEGNDTFRGTVNIDVFGTRGEMRRPGYVRVGTGTLQKRVVVRASSVKRVRVSVPIDPALPPGDYLLKVNINPPSRAAEGPEDFFNASENEVRYRAR
jgi:hypothetical protein